MVAGDQIPTTPPVPLKPIPIHPFFDAAGAAAAAEAEAVQYGTFMTLITKNDMLYSGVREDADASPNLIAFHLATIRELAGSELQMRPHTVFTVASNRHCGRRIDEFRTYYARRLINPGAPLRDNLVAELFQGGSRPLWMGLFGCYGLPLVHLSDSFEIKAATYAKQALALAASHLDDGLCGLFAAIAADSRRRSALFGSNGAAAAAGASRHGRHPLPKWTCDPLSILRDLSRDGRLSGLPLVLPGYTSHAAAGRPWSSVPVVGQVVLESVWRWDLAETVDPLDALEELGRVTTVALACGTHKTPGAAEFDVYLCFLPSLVLALRVFLAAVRLQYPAVSEIALVLVRCLWAQIVLVYILQLRPNVAATATVATPTPTPTPPEQGTAPCATPPDDDHFLFRAFYNDTALDQPRHQDAFYLRALRSFAMLAATERDPAWTARIDNAAVKLQVGWQRWLGLSPGEAATLDIRL
ncbi:hypothetical protein SPBR_09162 [Sporothrix brasiliensis 5110]|uniref:Uncharacterized protein n=1 Tax=Sporothrix brasiliensis 5110 TaxID=1398154 RepID=A0A0C2FQX4_9PEZI|nr:uncharacterized protein SPBR_09162 [Sporothrix brasiliensis 5110]KIH93438.1 hypothetical protein SPBR_09162 [Sporothrix brasiliensis 5110]